VSEEFNRLMQRRKELEALMFERPTPESMKLLRSEYVLVIEKIKTFLKEHREF
jgi:hypothetical protein